MPSASAVIATSVPVPWCPARGLSLARWSGMRRRQQRDHLLRKRARRERRRVHAGDAVGRLADQPAAAALVDVEGEADPPVRDLRDTDADRDLVTEPGWGPKPGRHRRPRHEHPEAMQQRRAVPPKVPVEILLGVLEVAAEDPEPDDAGRIRVGPHDAEVDVMKERHGQTSY